MIPLIQKKIINHIPVNKKEAYFLYKQLPLAHLMTIADDIRKSLHPDNKVTWLVDRNINISNICFSACKFCKFYRSINSSEAFVRSMDEYKLKIDELFSLGGNQLLLQGGLHPEWGISYYTDLFKNLKKEYPKLKLHALSPSEIDYLAKKEKQTYEQILEKLINAGLDSLPGGGAEILSDKIRSKISPNKCNSQEWVEVMKTAHRMGIVTSATMMFGHIETDMDRIEHLFKLQEVQNAKPKGAHGFLSFIPWVFIRENTKMENIYANEIRKVTASEYLRLIAISRIVLYNIPNIQPSMLTVGKETAQLSLHAGANDMGSVLLEENVISESDKEAFVGEEAMKTLIKQAGFIPVKRDQNFNFLS